MKLKIQNNQSMIRDTDSMAILNVDLSSLRKDEIYQQKMLREKALDEKINTLREDVDSIKTDLSKIVQMLESFRGHN